MTRRKCNIVELVSSMSTPVREPAGEDSAPESRPRLAASRSRAADAEAVVEGTANAEEWAALQDVAIDENMKSSGRVPATVACGEEQIAG